jgi:hypothetical protein
MDWRRKIVEPDNPDLSITAQCRLLAIGRSGYYYASVPENGATLALMAVIDQVFMACPQSGTDGPCGWPPETIWFPQVGIFQP